MILADLARILEAGAALAPVLIDLPPIGTKVGAPRLGTLSIDPALADLTPFRVQTPAL